MQKDKGKSIKNLQSQMKKELSRLSQSKVKGQFFSKSLSNMNFDLLEEQPERTSIRSNSSRKLNTSLTISSKSPQMVRQNSMETLLTKHDSSTKLMCRSKESPNPKLKKKVSKKDQGLPFIKLKRGDTLPEQLSHLIASTTSLQLKCCDSNRREQKTASEYQEIIDRYRKKISELENIIESMMQC